MYISGSWAKAAESGRALEEKEAREALEAAALVKDCKECLNYAGMEEDLNALIDVCMKSDIDTVRGFIKMNYPEGKSTMSKTNDST